MRLSAQWVNDKLLHIYHIFISYDKNPEVIVLVNKIM